MEANGSGKPRSGPRLRSICKTWLVLPPRANPVKPLFSLPKSASQRAIPIPPLLWQEQDLMKAPRHRNLRMQPQGEQLSSISFAPQSHCTDQLPFSDFTQPISIPTHPHASQREATTLPHTTGWVRLGCSIPRGGSLPAQFCRLRIKRQIKKSPRMPNSDASAAQPSFFVVGRGLLCSRDVG